MENNSVAYATTNKLDRARYYMGGYWVFLATGKETNGQFALIEANFRKGFEPPPHTHTHEDESFHIVAGDVKFTVGDKEYNLTDGDFLHLPKGVPHSFKLQSDTAKLLMHLVPAGLEDFFMELSAPATELAYPPAPTAPPPPEWIKKAQALQQQYGITGLDNSKIKAS